MDFGESILLETPDEKLLVDCGSVRSEKYLKDKITIIQNELQQNQKKTSFMLTHFHDDHYKGYIEAYEDKDINFPEPFNIYMPWISFREENKIKLPILVCESIYLYMIYKQVDDTKNFLFWLKGQIEFILNMSNEDTKIILLKEGDIFTIGKEKMKVLWPEYISIQEDKENEEDKKTSEEDKKADEKTRKEEEIREKELRGIFQKIEDNMDKDQKEKFYECKEKIINNIIKFYKILDSNRRTNEEGIIEDLSIKNQMKTISDILEGQNRVLNKLNIIKNDLISEIEKRKEYKKYRNRLKRIFREDNNACSIVFRDYKGSSDEKRPQKQKYNILMTGDITADIIDKYLYKKYLKDTTYQYIKCPHHGTDTHYTVNIPKSDNLIISNGYGCKSYHKISSHYFYHGNELTRKYCTNRRCEIRDSNRSCEETNLSSSCEVKGFYSITIN